MGKELTKLVERAVIYARQGRMLAELGGYFTSAEQELIHEIYSRLLGGEKVDEESPVIAIKTNKPGRKGKISMSEAVKWFEETYLKWSVPLQKKRKELKPPKTRKILAYGLKERKDFDDEVYISAMVKIANLPEPHAQTLYKEVLKPQLSLIDGLKGLIETEIKSKK